jgi:hypothetical protein
VGLATGKGPAAWPLVPGLPAVHTAMMGGRVIRAGEAGVADLVTAEGTEWPTVSAAELMAAEALSATTAVTVEVASSASSLAASLVRASTGSLEPVAEAAGESIAALKQQLEDASKQLEELASGAQGLRASAQRAAAKKLHKLVGEISLAGTFAAASDSLAAIMQDLDKASQQVRQQLGVGITHQSCTQSFGRLDRPPTDAGALFHWRADGQVDIPGAVRDKLDDSAQRGAAIVQRLKGISTPHARLPPAVAGRASAAWQVCAL